MLEDFPIHSLDITSFWTGVPLFTSFGTGRPLWTLAIEWWIYMFFGWLILKDRIKMNNILYLLILVAFSIVPLYNLFYGRGHGLFLMWLFGAFIFLLLTKFYENIKKYFTPLWLWIIIGFLGSFGILYIYSWDAYNLLFAFFLCLIILFIIIMLDQKTPFIGTRKKPIHFLASYSYTLYLIHYSIFALMINLKTDMSGYLIFIIAFALSNVCAIVVAYFGEMRYKSVASYIKKKFMKPTGVTPKR